MNRYHHSSSPSVTGCFGELVAVLPMRHVDTNGHDEHIRASFKGGLAIELDQKQAVELARRLQEVIGSLPGWAADFSGATADLEEED